MRPAPRTSTARRARQHVGRARPHRGAMRRFRRRSNALWVGLTLTALVLHDPRGHLIRRRGPAAGDQRSLALLLWSVWQRRVRANLSASKEPALVDATGMSNKNPTAKVCRPITAGVEGFRRRAGDRYTAWQLASPLTMEPGRLARSSMTVDDQARSKTPAPSGGRGWGIARRGAERVEHLHAGDALGEALADGAGCPARTGSRAARRGPPTR